MEFFTQFHPPVVAGLSCPEPSLAQQQFKDEVDINVLLERFRVTGQMPSGVRLPTFGDFSAVTDYQSAMNAVLAAQDEFMKLPPNVRSRFGNSPQQLLEAVSDPSRRDELEKLGLFDKKVANAPSGDDKKAPPPDKKVANAPSGDDKAAPPPVS